MDSLTARYIARELDELWRDRRLRSCTFDNDRSSIDLAVEGTMQVVVDLSSPNVRLRASAAGVAGASSARRSLLEGYTVRGVKAPVDDRRLVVELARPGRFKGSPERRATLTVSALPTARGAELRDAGGNRLAAIGARVPPPVEARRVLSPEEVASAARSADEAALLAGRWMSRAVARWLVGEPELAADRYAMLVSDTPARPAWCGGLLLPFPMCGDAVGASSLIESPSESPGEAPSEASSETLAGGGGVPTPNAPGDRAQRACQRMRLELERAGAAPRLRAIADALTLLGAVPAPDELTLADGIRERVPAKPGESAREAAERLYATARSMDRALELLPARIAALESEMAQRAPAAMETRQATRNSAKSLPTLPYRSYRSSNGLEIRVGKGAAANDALTFKASSPDDVWLHARDSAGAHVVLRWQEDGSPPARALEEAAALAAWYSKSRGAALVPVDWTRRKYVRRARGGAPGAVIVQRARTVMVRPDGALEKRLRER